MNKIMKKVAILASVAAMAISTSASAEYIVNGRKIDQYEVKTGEQYTLKSGDNIKDNVEITEVYEKPGEYFGTNRTIKWIDTETGETGESTLGRWGDTRVYEAGTTFTEINVVQFDYS